MPVLYPSRNNRLCVEIRCANEAVIRLRHTSLTTDDMLVSVQGSNSFIELVLNSGFYQIQSSLSSYSITTFQIKKRKKGYMRLISAVYSP